MSARSGIGRRRGAGARDKSPLTSVIVVAVSFAVTLLVVVALGYASLSTPTKPARAPEEASNPSAAVVERADAADELVSKQFGQWAGVIRAELHLVEVRTSAMRSAKGGTAYQGVKAGFCKLDWDAYKRDPPSLPMFKMLVAASGCDQRENVITMDLAEVVQKTREYDKAMQMRQTHNSDDVHVMPPTGFVFHESRVGSTLVANSLTAMDPEGHRVYSESDPINSALKACELSECDMNANVALLRDVVYLLGRTRAPAEKRMFFKVSSIGSKRIHVMQKAFPSVPWIFVYRDPVQTMMSHMDPTKVKKMMRGRGAQHAVCLRAKNRPPKDLRQLVRDHGKVLDRLSDEEFCAAHLATLCESALTQIKQSNGKGAAVNYDGLVDKLMDSVIPNHFGVAVRDDARRRIEDVSKIYSKSKNGDKDWVADSQTKDDRSTPEIRDACELFLSESFSELEKLGVVSG